MYITDCTIAELEKIVVELGESKFRGKQLFEWFHQKMEWDYDQMSNLSVAFRTKLKGHYPTPKMKIAKKYASSVDNTIKYLFELEDSHIIEGVLMRYKHGNSVCISSQVGCRMGCKFCASTIDGLVRNLTISEMLGQIYLISKDVGEKISNIVIMGSGEPLEKLDITTGFVELINDPKGQNIGQRHITVSTCGLVPNIYALADKGFQITLAISLHAATDEKRKKIMPVANKYSIEEILKACKYYTQKTGRRITYEYALIAGVNDTPQDAQEIVNLLKGTICHVNLIPVNPIEEREFQTSDKKSVERFCTLLNAKNIETTVRRKLGEDIDAACGQLRRRHLNNRGE